MTYWGRVPSTTLCGYCNHSIGEGDPALFTKLPNVKRERVRCQLCAGPAPPDLPPLVLQRSTPQGHESDRMTRVNEISKPIGEWMPFTDR